MTTLTLKLNPSALLEIKNDDLEQRLETKMNDVNCFTNPIENMKETITYFRDKNHKSKKKYKIFKTITSTLELFDIVVNIGAITTSVTIGHWCWFACGSNFCCNCLYSIIK